MALTRLKNLEKNYNLRTGKLTKENVEKLLFKESNSQENKPPSFNRKRSIQKIGSINEDLNISETDLSFRLNEPIIKRAYLDFCKNQKDIEEFDLSSSLSSIDNDCVITSTQIDSQDSSLSQEILNKKQVKEAYLDFIHNEISQDDLDFIMNFTSGATKAKKPKSSQKNQHLDKSESKFNIKRNIDENNDKGKSKNKVIYKSISGKNEKQPKKKLKQPNNIEPIFFDIERIYRLQKYRDVGLYALCDKCNKARYLPDIKDPLDLPELWYCNMDPNKKYNKCEYPEEPRENEELLIDNKFNAGSIVWAKIQKNLWWPAMVDDEPVSEDYFWLEENSNTPIKYNVTFFVSDKPTRAWLHTSDIQPFKSNMTNSKFLPSKLSKYRQKLETPMKQAKNALIVPTLERLRNYSFVTRYLKALEKTKSMELSNSKGINQKTKNKTFRNMHYSLLSNESDSAVSTVLKELDWNDLTVDFSLLENEESENNFY